MSKLTIYKNNYMDATIVSNHFIDNYMNDANAAQLKIYLYLLRVMNSNIATSISDMADLFNYPEKDVIRALTYWEKRDLLSLEYDGSKNIIGIRIEEPTDKQGAEIVPLAPVVSILSKNVPEQSTTETLSVQESPVYKKPAYSLDELKAFKAQASTQQLLFIVEQYLQKPLSASNINTILFFSDKLNFSDDLIDYLVQYCVDRGKKDFRYMEKVALSWAENGVTTPQEAEKYIHKYDKITYAIMNALGKANSPTPKEVEFINRWRNDYGFEADVIFEACERTVLATEKHRFEYADKILSSWKNAKVHHKNDIQKIDELYQKKKNTATFAKQTPNNKFNQFKQHDYDFDAIEQALLSK